MRSLHWAAKCGRAADIKALIAAGASVDAATEAGVTPLMYAALQGWDDCVSILLEAGADTMLRTAKENSALDLARKKCAEAHDKIARFHKVISQLQAVGAVPCPAPSSDTHDFMPTEKSTPSSLQHLMALLSAACNVMC
eukprot:scaffold239123_cov27-Tisochrysis_lutea.AAC.1